MFIIIHKLILGCNFHRIKKKKITTGEKKHAFRIFGSYSLINTFDTEVKRKL